MCPRCAGRGIVKLAFKAADQTSDTGAPGVSGSYSPPPGSAPPTGVNNIARARARDVASGRQPERPIGPSSIRPVPPTILESPQPAAPSSGATSSSARKEEIVEETSGSSSGGSTSEATKESKGEGKPKDSPTYSSPGFVGWISKNKMLIVLGGVVLLILAVVFNKVSAKKGR